MKTAWLMVVMVLAGCASIGGGGKVMGTKPAYLESTTDAVPNAAALSHRIYTPSLDDGYVPQGLTAGDVGKLK